MTGITAQELFVCFFQCIVSFVLIVIILLCMRSYSVFDIVYMSTYSHVLCMFFMLDSIICMYYFLAHNYNMSWENSISSMNKVSSVTYYYFTNLIVVAGLIVQSEHIIIMYT